MSGVGGGLWEGDGVVREVVILKVWRVLEGMGGGEGGEVGVEMKELVDGGGVKD